MKLFLGGGSADGKRRLCHRPRPCSTTYYNLLHSTEGHWKRRDVSWATRSLGMQDVSLCNQQALSDCRRISTQEKHTRETGRGFLLRRPVYSRQRCVCSVVHLSMCRRRWSMYAQVCDRMSQSSCSTARILGQLRLSGICETSNGFIQGLKNKIGRRNKRCLVRRRSRIYVQKLFFHVYRIIHPITSASGGTTGIVTF
jgi:hypothetical protein